MKINNIFIYALNVFLYYLSLIVPKKKNTWIFGAWMGNKYADNSKYLFEFINENCPSINAIWITDDQGIVNELRKKNVRVYKKYSLGAIYWGLKASCSIFVHSNMSDVMPFLNNKKTKLIQLWHGIPLKKIGFDDTKYTYKVEGPIKAKIKSIFFPFLLESYDVIIASSNEDKEKFVTAFRNTNIYITGYPRNDILIKNKSHTDINKELIVTYLPTFRDGIGASVDLFSSYKFDVTKWEEVLKMENIKLKIKMHPVNRPSNDILNLLNSIDQIEFLDEIDITDYLNKTDILITDYSSVYFDYLLTEKPIIFSPFDYELYLSKDRELYYVYNEVTPGPKCKDWSDVLGWIINFKNNMMLYSDERTSMCNKFHRFNDKFNSLRVYELIQSIIK